MAVLTGASWNFDKTAETLYRREKIQYNNFRAMHQTLETNKIIDKKINNFGRISTTSKLYTVLTALAIYDSSCFEADLCRDDIGLSAYKYDSATQDNNKYFTDYVQAGRTLARGNLFVYTLPSSPLGEAAIAFNLKGPVLYLSFTDKPLYNFIDQVELMLDSSLAKGFIALYTDLEGTVCLFFRKNLKENCRNKTFTSEDLKAVAGSIKPVSFVKRLQNLQY